MTSKLTRERLLEIAEDGFLKHGESKELASMVLAAMDSEPVAEVLSTRPGNDTSTIDRALPVGTQLYRHAQTASEREQVRREHAEWSQATFGNVGPIGPLKHLSKEALEAAAEPDDLSEWADMQFLMWDAQRRAGITDAQITQAMIEKLAVNKQRSWPEPKDGEPRQHIKAQPAPVGPVCTCPSGDGSLRWPCPVHPGNSPAIPDSARDALEKALAAMEFMGDTLNNLDAVCTEDVELVAPAFDAVRSVLAAALQEGK